MYMYKLSFMCLSLSSLIPQAKLRYKQFQIKEHSERLHIPYHYQKKKITSDSNYIKISATF